MGQRTWDHTMFKNGLMDVDGHLQYQNHLGASNMAHLRYAPKQLILKWLV